MPVHRIIARIPARLFILPFVAAMAACNSSPQPSATQTSAPASTPPASTYQNVPAGVTPASFRMPSGAGCKGDVARWDAIQNNDLRSGHVTPAVFKQIQGEITQARAVCNAGEDARASAMVRASKSRHGYPTG